MLYRRMRRKNLHYYSYRKPLPPAQRRLAFVLIIILVAAAALSIILFQLRPILQKLATAQVTESVLYDINSVIDQEISNGTFDYNQLVTLEKDDEGNVSALITNMALINTLQARLSKNILQRVETESVTELKIPLGNVVGGVMFSGRGPSLYVKILSVASTTVKFTNDFSAAGINQTRHKIMLLISVELDVFVPGTKTMPRIVQTEVEVCETVIVGKVPNVYASIGDPS